MNKISLLSICAIFLLCCAGPAADWWYPEEVLGGDHPLRKITTTTASEGYVGGGFFLFVGGVYGSFEATTRVQFAWLMNDKETWAISSLPLEKIRVRLKETESGPYMQFQVIGRRGVREYTNLPLQDILDRKVISATVVCRAEDWPVNINMPLNAETLRKK